MSAMLTGRAWFVATSLLLIVLFGLANLALQPVLAPARLDFTERSLYTLTPATRTTLRGLVEPVDVTLVYSRRVGQDFPRIRAHAARVRELLDAYEGASGGRLRVREIDPVPFSEAEDEALAAGITAVPTQEADPLYFGLIGRNTVDDTRIIPFLAPEREGTLEYDLTRLIARLDNPAPPRIGLLSSLQGMQGDGRETGYSVLQDMARNYDLVRIEPDFVSLPERLDALMIAHADTLNDYQLWLVDQYVLRQGRLVWLVDPAAKVAGSGGVFDLSEAPGSSDLGTLGRHWGVTLADGAVADASNALPVQTETPDGRATIAGQPLFIAAPPATMSRTDPITSELPRAVNFGAPGALLADPAEGLTFSPLVETGPAPSLIAAERAVSEMSPADVIVAYEAEDAPRTLAGRLTGRATTAFSGGKPPVPLTGDPVIDELARAAAEDALAHIERSAQDVSIVLIADVDLLDDGFFINPNGGAAVADNGTLILNALDAVTGVEGLLALRSRAEALRTMTRVDDMRAAAEAEFFEEQARLEDRLVESQTQLEALQAELAAGMATGGELEAGLTPAERGQLQRLREDILQTRSRIRTIERDFRRDIDGLEAWLKAVNIWGGAGLMVLLGFGLWMRERRRMA